MNTDADKLAAEKAATDKRAADEAATAAAGDPVTFTAYTVDEREVLRNPASPDPVRERGD